MGTGAERAVLELAASRHGVFSRSEAASLGVTPSRIRTNLHVGRWRVAAPGVLAVVGIPATSKQKLAAVTLSRSGRPVASHRAAAALHGLDGCRPGFVEVSVVGTAVPRVDAVVHRVAALDPVDVTWVDGIRTTTVVRTLCDLGAVVPRARVEQALDDTLRMGVDLRLVEQAANRLWRPGPTGVPVLAAILGERSPDSVPESWFERLVLKMLHEAGLPTPVVQYEVRDQRGRFVARVDAAYPRLRIAIEADSERFHGAPGARVHDLQRTRRLRRAGWEVVPVTWRDLREPDAVLTDLRLAIERRSLELGA
jgi:very-short-patch-repair endonuclease